MRLFPHWLRAGLGALLAVVCSSTAGARADAPNTDSAPKFAQALNNLGLALREMGRHEEAVAAYRKAIELDPKCALAHKNLGLVLKDKGRLDEAMTEYKKAIELDPKFSLAHNNLGSSLRDKGRLDDAIAEYKIAIELDPKSAPPHTGLGNVLFDKGRLDEAIAEHKIAIGLEPEYALPHFNLGICLHHLSRLDEAIAEYKKAIKLDPKYAPAHFSLGLCLHHLSRLDEAIVEYKKAIELDPNDAVQHTGLGGALIDKGLIDGAIAENKKAIELDPKDAVPHCNLAICRQYQRRWDDAVAEYKKAIELDPKFADAHANLGPLFILKGQFTEARQAFQRCRALLPENHPVRPEVALQIQRCDRMISLGENLTAFLKGEVHPANATEQVALADWCHVKRRFADAVRFSTDAFAAEPNYADDLQSGYRYAAACYAVLAAAGQGKDAAKLDDKERARLRKQALDWLRADLTLWRKQTEKGNSQERAAAQKALRCWQYDPYLAGLRDAVALDKLPEAERAACRNLWNDVAALLKK